MHHRFFQTVAITLATSCLSALCWADTRMPLMLSAPDTSNTPAITSPNNNLLDLDKQWLSELKAHRIKLTEADQPFQETQAVSRSEWIQWLYTMESVANPYVSEFPYYRDVDTAHPAFIAIETFRTRHWLDALVSPDGHFYPDQPIHHQEALLLLAQTFQPAWFKQAESQVQLKLAAWNTQLMTLNAPQKALLAKCLDGGFLPPQAPSANFLSQPVTRLDALRLLHKRLQLDLDNTKTGYINTIDANVILPISPTSIVYFKQLAVGQPIFFAVAEDVPIPTADHPPNTIPKGSRVKGIVNELNNDQNTMNVTFDKVLLPTGEPYQLYATANVVFSESSQGGKKEGKHSKPKKTPMGMGNWLTKLTKLVPKNPFKKKPKGDEAPMAEAQPLILPANIENSAWIVPGNTLSITTQAVLDTTK